MGRSHLPSLALPAMLLLEPLLITAWRQPVRHCYHTVTAQTPKGLTETMTMIQVSFLGISG